MKWLLIMLALLVDANIPQHSEALVSLQVNVTNLRSERGNLALSLYRTPQGWPDIWQQAERSMKVAIHKDPQQIILKDLPAGRYAVAVIHDENESGAMDKNLMGVPKEGYGVSNNAKAGLFGPPKFKEAQFDLDSNNNVLEIEINY